MQVGTVDSSVDDVRIDQSELVDNRRQDLLGGGGGQREHRRPHPVSTQRGDSVADFEIRWPEIMPPLRHAMRLVDDDHVDRRAAEGLAELECGEPLRGSEDELRPGRGDPFEVLRCLTRRLGAVDGRRGQADLRQFVGLILHQRDERRDDEGRPVEKQRGYLIAQ